MTATNSATNTAPCSHLLREAGAKHKTTLPNGFSRIMFAPAIGVEWLSDARAAIDAHNKVGTRPLSKSEEAALVAGGNAVADKDWSRVRVRREAGEFNPAAVQRCTFAGDVELGVSACTGVVASRCKCV
jgi:hypothetical protein